MNILGMNIKNIKQWGDKKVFTKGEIYTIGIERIFLDVKTQKADIERFFFILYPYEITDYNKRGNSNSIEYSLFYRTLPFSYSSFIKKRKDSLYFIIQNKNILITNIFGGGLIAFIVKEELVDKQPNYCVMHHY